GAIGISKPSVSAPPAAATLTRNDRRSIRCMVTSSSCLGGGMNRRADALISAAATDVGNRGIDLGVGRLRLPLQQRGDRHDHAALAIAALRDVEIEPGLLHLVQRS